MKNAAVCLVCLRAILCAMHIGTNIPGFGGGGSDRRCGDNPTWQNFLHFVNLSFTTLTPTHTI